MTAQMVAEQLAKHVTDCMEERIEGTKALNALTDEVGKVRKIVNGYEAASKLVKKTVWASTTFVVASVIGAAITVLVTARMNHNDVNHKVEQTALTTAYYTAQDAARDRDAQEARDQRIMMQLGRLDHRKN